MTMVLVYASLDNQEALKVTCDLRSLIRGFAGRTSHIVGVILYLIFKITRNICNKKQLIRKCMGGPSG